MATTTAVPVGQDEATTPAELVRDFANTIDVEDDVDLLDSPAGLTRWLREHELLRRGTADNAALDLALRLRTEIRSALSDHHDGVERSHAKLERIASELPMRLTFPAGDPVLVPASDGVRAALGQVVVAMARTEADGTWQRLKLCREDTCQWAFLDTSKNRSRTWCSMGICGNRNKTRAYRSRQRPDAEDA
jgi:predicted RNA-binding Zn ribbon-like protein